MLMRWQLCTSDWLPKNSKKYVEQNGDWIESAKWAWKKHQEYSKVATNECGYHIYRVMAGWVVSTDRKDDAHEVKKHGPQFQTAIKVFAKRLVKEPDLSLAYYYT